VEHFIEVWLGDFRIDFRPPNGDEEEGEWHGVARRATEIRLRGGTHLLIALRIESDEVQMSGKKAVLKRKRIRWVGS
jgi:hypothetical protein